MTISLIEQQMVVEGELIQIASQERFNASNHSLFMALLEEKGVP